MSSDWISVKTRYPARGQTVLAYSEAIDAVTLVCFDRPSWGDVRWYAFDQTGDLLERVTHWQPLPGKPHRLEAVGDWRKAFANLEKEGARVLRAIQNLRLEMQEAGLEP
jgi:Protein of unknown function (DUF551)